MMKEHEKLHTNVRRVVNRGRKMSVHEYINKKNVKLQHKVWKPGRLKKTVTTKIKKHNEEGGY